MTLGDGFVAVCPYPQELRESLHYWRKSLEFNEKSRRREMRSRREELCQLVDRVGPGGIIERMLVTMPGFASRVKSFLTRAGWDVSVDDKRTPLPRPDVEKAMTGLRDYQMPLVWDLLMSNGGLLQGATGLGKTYVIRALCNAFSHETLMARGTPTIVVAAPDKDINRKNWEELSKLLPDRDVGIIMSGANKQSDDIQVITLDSLHKLDADDVGVLIVDEVHAAASDTRSSELLRFTKAIRWGVSATPDGRFDGKDMVTEGIFGPVVSRFTFQDGVKAGALVPITVLWLPAPEPHIGVDAYRRYNTRDKRYQWGVHRNNALNALIGQIFAGIPDELQTLGMMQFTKHMEYVLRGCQAASPGSLPEQVHAETAKDGFPPAQFRHMHPISPKERKEIYNRMRAGEIRKALSTHVWKQGVDFTDLRIVVNIGGGGSDIVAKQVPGRACRTSAGKERAYIVEFEHAWDTVVRDGRERPGPVLADDRSRRRVYTELGFDQIELKGVFELPWMNNSSTQLP